MKRTIRKPIRTKGKVTEDEGVSEGIEAQASRREELTKVEELFKEVEGAARGAGARITTKEAYQAVRGVVSGDMVQDEDVARVINVGNTVTLWQIAQMPRKRRRKRKPRPTVSPKPT